MPMPVTVRPATPADIPAVLALEAQAPTAAHWSREQYVRRVEGGCVLVAVDKAICGFVCTNIVAGEWEIENIVVAPSCRRQGTADRLMRELFDRARNANASAILLEVRESNLPGRGLYAKHGFEEAGRRRTYYKDPPEEAILYSFHFGTRAGNAS